MDFCELLVPEGGEVDPADAGVAARDAGLVAGVLAARVNVDRDLASRRARPRGRRAVAYLRLLHRRRGGVRCRSLVGGPLYGTPLVFAGRLPRPLRRRRESGESASARVVDGLKQGGAYAETEGRASWPIEPLNRFETDFCNTGRQACALARDGRQRGGRSYARHVPHEHGGERHIQRRCAMPRRNLMHFPGQREPSRLPRHRTYRLAADLPRAVRHRLRRAPSRWSRSVAPHHALSVPLAQWKPPAYDEDDDLRHSGAFLRAALRAAVTVVMGASKLRIGWIGCGTHASEMLLPQLSRLPVTLAAIVRHQPRERLALVGDRYGVAVALRRRGRAAGPSRARRGRHGGGPGRACARWGRRRLERGLAGIHGKAARGDRGRGARIGRCRGTDRTALCRRLHEAVLHREPDRRETSSRSRRFRRPRFSLLGEYMTAPGYFVGNPDYTGFLLHHCVHAMDLVPWLMGEACARR